MGTREVYEEKLRTGNLYDHDPTMNPGLGTPRCPRCLSLLDSHSIIYGGFCTFSCAHHCSMDCLGDIYCSIDNLTSVSVFFFWKNGEWAITSVLHDATTVTGTRLGALLNAIHGFNTGIPFVQKHVKGPKWLPFVVGFPPLLISSAACAAFGGYAFPRFTQLTVTSYYVTSSAPHFGISLLTRYIEEAHTSIPRQEKH